MLILRLESDVAELVEQRGVGGYKVEQLLIPVETLVLVAEFLVTLVRMVEMPSPRCK